MSFRPAAAALLALVAIGPRLMGCADSRPTEELEVELRPSLEDQLPDGSPYSPTTQSMLRHSHWLETISRMSMRLDGNNLADARLDDDNDAEYIEFADVPLDYLVPRLNYAPADPPDAFDAFNLMLAEYSRNSISVPAGRPGDTMAHFETSLAEGHPWKLAGDYDFIPNARFRPVRMGLVNNCLRPGLWEIFGADRSGEIYHAWFDFPSDAYFDLVARTNGLTRDFVEPALEWRPEPTELRLPRLREMTESFGEVALSLADDSATGYSSQDSRRKLEKGFVVVADGAATKDSPLRRPEKLAELTDRPIHMSSFDPPGKYSIRDRKQFDLRFLRETRQARVLGVSPHTDYAWNRGGDEAKKHPGRHLELRLELNDYTIILGNLPVAILAPQTDFAIHGFGVGVLPSGGFAERRKFLIEEGPAPSFAYLCKQEGDELIALNSHEFGLEQIFIRTHLGRERAWWEITLTSYERIVDLIKYEVEIPEALREELDEARLRYIAPLYLTYRDDNLR